MRKYEAEKKAIEEFGDCRLHYKIVSEGKVAENNAKNFEKMRKALEAVGVRLSMENGELSLEICPEGYIRAKNRNAGRRKKFAWNRERYEVYRYSDIVFLSQIMKDKELAEKIGMPIATFYRHKKALRESDYFQSLDLNRLREKEYLESMPGNYSF